MITYPQTGHTTKTTTTIREFDAEGRVIKETVTETSYPNYGYYPQWGGGFVVGSATNDTEAALL